MPADHDLQLRFLLPAAGVRGVIVCLDASWREVQARARPPADLVTLLGEALAAAALFTGHIKVDGRLSLQLRGGSIGTLFAECTAAGTLRGIARLREGATAAADDLRALGSDGLLALTVENPGLGAHEPTRHQGLVALEAARLAEVLEGYFDQSEQLPTRLRLACSADRAAGLLVQQLPGEAGADTDGMRRAGALLETLSDDELLTLDPELVLHRLFHEEAPELLATRPLRFGCSCSRGRVADVLLALGHEEADAAVAAGGGTAEVGCEFCGQDYRFTAEDVANLFTRTPTAQAAPSRLQ